MRGGRLIKESEGRVSIYRLKWRVIVVVRVWVRVYSVGLARYFRNAGRAVDGNVRPQARAVICGFTMCHCLIDSSRSLRGWVEVAEGAVIEVTFFFFLWYGY